MIWSLFKIIAFVAFVAALTVGAAYVIETGTDVRLAFGSREFTLSPLAGIIGVALLLLGIWIALRLFGLMVAVFRFFNGDETAISRYFDRSRERRGYEALADGMMALASGEGKLAIAKASKAEKYLKRPELTLLLSAQAAEMTGETKRAQGFYKQLLADDRTRFVGVQGILKQKLVEGDTDTALKLAEKAFALRPRHEKTMDVLFSLQSDKSDWRGARKTLGAKLRAKTLPKDVHTRRDAVLALAEARELIEAGDIETGHQAAMQANRLSPGLIPAAVLTAEMHVLKGAAKTATKVLRKAWGTQPHPELAAAFADIAPGETPAQRLTRFQTLLKMAPQSDEVKMLTAELALVADDYVAARKAVQALAETDPTTRSLTIMAAIERGEGAPDNVVRGWLTKALSASRGPQWICSSCKQVHANWTPVCENCAHFDTLSWDTPQPGSETTVRSTEMLPLIVGTLEDQSSDVEIPAEAEAEQVPVTPKPNIDDLPNDMDGIMDDPPVLPGLPSQRR